MKLTCTLPCTCFKTPVQLIEFELLWNRIKHVDVRSFLFRFTFAMSAVENTDLCIRFLPKRGQRSKLQIYMFYKKYMFSQKISRKY